MTIGLVCVDASVVVRLLVANAAPSKITSLWRDWAAGQTALIAPTLLYYEVANALHRYVTASLLLPEEGTEALERALALDIELYGDANLHRRALELTRRYNLPAAYDAHYLALTERFHAEFWTADRKLAHAVQAQLGWVHWVE